MRSRRVKLGDIPLWGRFRRVGAYQLSWVVRVTQHDYCEEKDVAAMQAAVARFPTRPGPEHYTVDKLLESFRARDGAFDALAAWNRAFAFSDEDVRRADKKDFLVPEGPAHA